MLPIAYCRYVLLSLSLCLWHTYYTHFLCCFLLAVWLFIATRRQEKSAGSTNKDMKVGKSYIRPQVMRRLWLHLVTDHCVLGTSTEWWQKTVCYGIILLLPTTAFGHGNSKLTILMQNNWAKMIQPVGGNPLFCFNTVLLLVWINAFFDEDKDQ